MTLDGSVPLLDALAATSAVPDVEPVVRSIYQSQDDILRGIIKLHCPEGFECDATYGKGGFWKTLPAPALKFDREPLVDGVIAADYAMLPLRRGELNNIVIDPPFLTYIRANRGGNGKMVMSRQYSGFWTYGELEDNYLEAISEAHRVLRRGGKLIFKCQDIIHNHAMHCTHANVINMAENEGFRLRDLLILQATHRMPSPNRNGRQRHARIFHSYFLVLEAI